LLDDIAIIIITIEFDFKGIVDLQFLKFIMKKSKVEFINFINYMEITYIKYLALLKLHSVKNLLILLGFKQLIIPYFILKDFTQSIIQ